MRHEEAASTLRRSGWLSGQPAHFQDALLAGSRLQFHPAGEYIFRMGDPPGDLCGLVEGELSVFIAPDTTRPALVHVAQPGWWAGELALITGTPRRVSLVARLNSWVMHVGPDCIEKLARDDNQAWRYVARIVAANLDHAMGQAASWNINDAHARVALTLRRLAGLRPNPAESAILHISHEELGSMSRLTRNAVAPILAQLETAGLVRRGYRQLEIPDVAAIARYAAERIAALEDSHRHDGDDATRS